MEATAERTDVNIEDMLHPALTDAGVLKAIGFWNGYNENRFIDPSALVDEGWEDSNKGKIIAYLNGFPRINHQNGYSYCRFGCNEGSMFDPNMGCAERSDGIWVWPEGLVHYVDDHYIKLPSEFVDTMKSNDFKCVDDVGQGIVDYGFWEDWCNKVRGLGNLGWEPSSGYPFN